MSAPPAPPPPPLRRYRELQPLPPRSSARRDFFDQRGVSQVERPPYPEYRYTKYFWTINSQRAAYNRDQAVVLKDILAKSVLDVFISGVAVAFAHPNHEFNRIYIGENVLQMVVEIGPKHGKVHLHMIQHLAHRSYVNIDPADVAEKVQEKIFRNVGVEMRLHVSKTSHESEQPLLAYVDKGNVDWGQEGRNPHGIWTYSWNNDGMSRDWTCSHPVVRVFGGASDIGSGFINNDEPYEPEPEPEPAPAQPVRRIRQPEYARLIPEVNMTPANRIRTANTPLAPPPPPANRPRGRARELNELLEAASNFSASSNQRR
jgi:hypothetical protein